MYYSVKAGDSPAKIARRYGVTMSSLVRANSHKPITTVAGQRTWQSLRHGETISVPVGGMVGGWLGAIAPAAPNAPHKQISITNPGPHVADADVALWQSIIGVTADGLFGPNTQAKTKSWQSAHGLAADGIVGPKSWTAALGGGGVPVVALPAPPPPPSPSMPSMPAAIPTVSPVSVPGPAQVIASIDPCLSDNVQMVCAAQRALGVTADGKYGSGTATALRKLIPSAPAGCSPRPSWWAPTGKSNCNGAAASSPAAIPSLPSLPSLPSALPLPVSTPAMASLPAAVQALVSADPCASSNAAMVCAAQAALGVSVDGKYGSGTATALRRLVPTAPAGCSPRPSWWAPTGQTNCGGAPSAIPSLPSLPSLPAPSASPVPSFPDATPAAAPAMPSVVPAGVPGAPASSSSSTTITAPTKAPLSTGAIVAGAVGAVALVGLIAVAASGKKSSTSRTTTIRRAPAHKSAHKKSGKRKRK